MEPNVTAPTESAYEFSEEQNKVLKSLSNAMRWVGAVMLVVGVLQFVAGLFTMDKGGLATSVQGAIVVIFAVYTYKAAYAFRRIVDSAGQDIAHLMAAICSLRNLYRLQVIILAMAALALLVVFASAGIGALAR